MNVRYFKVGMHYKWNMPRAFPLEILLKKHKIASPEKFTSSDKKDRTSSVFMLE